MLEVLNKNESLLKDLKEDFDVYDFLNYGPMFMPKSLVEAMGGTDAANYARWVMHQYNVPASMSFDFEKFRRECKLYCTYKDRRYRYSGHSRHGDVWIREDFHSSEGYDLRVNIYELTNFSKEP